jgi:predicted regulator of Ras-like GTPase activity (Roadblock/LC7/MglB family)
MITKKETQTPAPNVDGLPKLYVQLEQVAKMAGVQGYIRRNDVTATVNLREQGRVQEYALLSADAFVSSEQLIGVFKLGGFSDFVVECEAFKVLCLCVGDEAVCVFMDKCVDAVAVKTLLLQN